LASLSLCYRDSFTENKPKSEIPEIPGTMFPKHSENWKSGVLSILANIVPI
jgi:hypothetical protein